MDIAVISTLAGVAFAALVGAIGFILQGMRSDISELRSEHTALGRELRAEIREIRSENKELGAKVDMILFALVQAGLLTPQHIAGTAATIGDAQGHSAAPPDRPARSASIGLRSQQGAADGEGVGAV